MSVEDYEFGFNFWREAFMMLILSGFLMGGTIILWYCFKGIFLGVRKLWSLKGR